MKIAALILGLLGSFILFVFGVHWIDDADHLKEVEATAQTYQKIAKEAAEASGHPVEHDPKDKELMSTLDVVRGKAKACYPMIVCGLVAFIASFFVFKLPKVSGGIMALSVLVPAVIYVVTLFFSFPLLLAALFAFLAKPKARVVASLMVLAVLGLGALASAQQKPVIELEEVQDPGMGYSIRIPKGSKDSKTELFAGSYIHNYERPINNLVSYTVEVSKGGATSLDAAVSEATLGGTMKTAFVDKKEMNGGFLLVEKPFGPIQTAWFFKNGKKKQVRARCTGPAKDLAVVLETCGSLKVVE